MGNNRITALFLSASLLFLSCGEPKGKKGTQNAERNLTSGEIAEQDVISGEDISSSLRYLSSDELKGRETGTEGIERAASYIEDTFKENDIQPFFETYRDSFMVDGVTGYNVVGFKKGTDPQLQEEYILIGAHYDHIGRGKPVGNDSIANGANDNASGTVAVLELAKYFADVETKRSIIFALFSAEEMGLEGSKHLADRLKEEEVDLYVMFNIEMIGIPMEDRDYLAYLTGHGLTNMADKFNKYAGEKVLGFLPQAREYSLFRRSDNYPFYEEFGIPAQTISTFDFTNYDFYHHVEDEFEYMNISHMEELIEEIIPGIKGMANNAEREIKIQN